MWSHPCPWPHHACGSYMYSSVHLCPSAVTYPFRWYFFLDISNWTFLKPNAWLSLMNLILFRCSLFQLKTLPPTNENLKPKHFSWFLPVLYTSVAKLLLSLSIISPKYTSNPYFLQHLHKHSLFQTAISCQGYCNHAYPLWLFISSSHNSQNHLFKTHISNQIFS